jgi:NET1-associated nuclear protein 1 (U3 small nucleolar RNA-associated protein 17)
MATEEPRVKVSIFQASSSIPSHIYSIPFTLRSVELNLLQASTDFRVVAITQSWKIVLIGDSVPSSTDEGLSPKAISPNEQRQNRTLFQDLFGASAFEEDLPVDPPSTSVALSRKGTLLSDIPAYASPSFDTFFDPLLTTFLTAREPQDEDRVKAREEIPVEDDLMDQSEDTISMAPHGKCRLPNPGELEVFTKLFRSTCNIAAGMFGYPRSRSHNHILSFSIKNYDTEG